MKISVVQMSIDNNVENNYLKIKNIISNMKKSLVDLVVFPEMTLTGFDKNTIENQKKISIYLNELYNLSDEKNIALILGHPEKKGDKIYNTASIILPGHKVIKYQKKHLTNEETKYFTCGEKNQTFSYKGMKFGVVICKDQNFPEQIIEQSRNGITALFILAGHYYKPGEARMKLRKNKALPIVRALENKIYVFKSNAVGHLFNKISLGSSMIINPEGTVISQADEFSQTTLEYDIIDSEKIEDRCLL